MTPPEMSDSTGDRNTILTRAAGLADAVGLLAVQLKRIRWWQRLGLTVLAFDLVLTSAFAVNWIDTRRAQASAKSVCQASNIGRAAAVTLWDHVLVAPPNASPVLAKQINDLRAFAELTYVQHKC